MALMSVRTARRTGRSALSARANAGPSSDGVSTRRPRAPMPHLEALGLLAAVGGHERAFVLVQCEVVVDQDDGVDPVTHGGFQFGGVIEEAAVAAEAHHGSLRCRASGGE